MKRFLISWFKWLVVALMMAHATASDAQIGLRPHELPAADYNRQLSKLIFNPSIEPIQPLRVAMLNPVSRYEDLAFFCRLEVRIEQKLRFPLKFRLGDVAYVDWLEGKRKF